VERFKRFNEIMAVTGNDINDDLALKTVNIGFSIDIANTEIAKEISEIIIMDNNFASIVRIII
jgi:Ca2+-transporting ATPase